MMSTPCTCPTHVQKPAIKLQPWMLECWQREQYRRPYTTLTVHGRVFRRKLNHTPDVEDLHVVVEFLNSRALTKFELCYIKLPGMLGEALALAVRRLESIVLLSVALPVEVLQTFARHEYEFMVKDLRLAGNPLSDDHVSHLCDFLLTNTTVQSLDLGHCDMDARRFSVIADAVLKSKSLLSINMSKIVPLDFRSLLATDKIASIIAILIHQRPLVEVHFKACGLGCHDMAPIAEYLADSTSSLRFLDLGSNRIGPHGCRLLFEAVAKGKALTGLDLSNNQLREGGLCVGHLLPKTRLKYLDIANNQIPAESTELILKTLTKPYPIRVLNMVGNAFNEAGALTLRRKLVAGVLVATAVDICVAYNIDADKYEVQTQTNETTPVNATYWREARQLLNKRSNGENIFV